MPWWNVRNTFHIADQSEHSWETVAAYIGNDVAANEDDVRRIEKAEKTAEQRVSKWKRKAAATTASQRTSPKLSYTTPRTTSTGTVSATKAVIWAFFNCTACRPALGLWRSGTPEDKLSSSQQVVSFYVY